MKVRCCDCLNNVDLINLYRHCHYCNVKKIWIPERKYERRRKCGKFKPLPWQYEPRETEPTRIKTLPGKKLRWRDREYWRGFLFLPGFLGRKLRQITKYASKVTIVD